MTGWNKYGNPLAINSYFNVIYDDFIKFLETLPRNTDDEPFWDIDDGEIKPISYTYTTPKDYIGGYIAIVKWLKNQNKCLNIESGYAFTYQNEENYDERSVGGINSNVEGITLVQVNGDGKIIQEFHKLY